jgi:C2 domain
MVPFPSFFHSFLLFLHGPTNLFLKGKSDPFVIIEHGKFKKQTKTKEKTLNPVWHELFFMYVKTEEKKTHKNKNKLIEKLITSDQ